MARASAVAVFAVALAAAASGGSTARAGDGCALWAAWYGSDANAGTPAAPLRSLGHLFATLKPGQTGCVTAGTRFDEHVLVTKHDVHVRVFGAPATLNGRLRFRRDGAGSSLENVVVRGDGPAHGAIVTVAADRVTLTNLDVSGPNFVNGKVTCVRVKGANVALRFLHVHDCTKITSKHVYAPGIVVSGRGVRVLGNTVFHVPGDGVVVGPNASGVLVSHNVLYGNTSGIHVHAPSSGTIANNVITFSGNWNVHGDGGGTGVIVTANCLWGSNRGDVGGTGFRAYGNIVRFPFTDFTHFQLRRGPCAAKGPQHLGVSTPIVRPGAPKLPAKKAPPPKRTPTLPRFLVQYTLRALPARVQFVSLSFTGLKEGAAVSVRCSDGCSAAEEHLTAPPGGTAFSAGLGGRWLARGTVITVSERLGGWHGAYARIVVTGLPHGLRVSHGVLG